MALWELPDYTTLRQKIIETVIQLRTALGTAPDSGPGSDVDVTSTTLATIEQRLNRYIRLGIAMLFPQSASGEGSIGWAIEMGLSDGQGGYGPILPDVASATDGLTCTATGATVDIQNLTLLDTAGLQYKVNESYTFAGAGSANVDIISIDTGLAANLPVGSALTFESPVANLNADATIAVSLTGGVDAEEDPDINDRVLDKWRAPSLSGNNVHWKRWVEETDEGVLDGFVWPTRYGGGILGTVDYGGLNRGLSRDRRVLSATQLAAITANIQAEAPIDLMNNSRNIQIVPDVGAPWTKNANIELYPGASDDALPDFDAYNLNADVSSWDSGTLRITADKNVAGAGVDADQAIAVGDTVIIGCATSVVTAVEVGADQKVFQVATNFATYDATLNPYPWITGWGPGGARICSGGGVVDAALVATMNYIDSIGPPRGSYAASDDISWDDELRYKKLQAAIDAADNSIMDVSVTPATDLVPTDPGAASLAMNFPTEISLMVIQ